LVSSAGDSLGEENLETMQGKDGISQNVDRPCMGLANQENAKSKKKQSDIQYHPGFGARQIETP